MTSHVSSFFSNLVRKKTLSSDLMRSDLKKCLNLGDLTFLAIGSMVGSGLYVLTGTVARDIAGPSVIISYVFAAIASCLSAICYAEFGARVPVTGSAYVFTYLSVGEFWAFLVGWNVLIEHIVSAAAVAKAWSGYLDSLIGQAVSKYLIEHVPMPGGVLATYPDFIAVAFLLVSAVILVSGAQISSKFTTIFAAVNLVVIVIVFGTGMYLADISNWTTVRGGFFPYGWSGTISGASTLVFSYVGYEIIASSTEEAVKPSRDVPLSLLIALSVVALAYVGASAALTLMVPWYKISRLAPFPEAYEMYGWTWARYLISVGAMAAMTTTSLTAMFVVPRYLLAMARDGLLMKCFAKVNEITKVPTISVLVCFISCIAFAILFPINVLVEFISIGQLLACTFVSFCVIKLRYQPNSISRYMELQNIPENRDYDVTTSDKLNLVETSANTNVYGTSAQGQNPDDPTNAEKQIGAVKLCVLKSPFGFIFVPLDKYSPGTAPFLLLMISTTAAIITIIIFLSAKAYLITWWCITLIVLFSLLSSISIMTLLVFNQDSSIKTFKVPLVPFIPFISIVINVILILKLQPLTWLRFAIWMLIGIILYIVYGYRYSNERRQD